MNILIPHTWLLEHLETEAEPAIIQKYLSLCGPSVERIYEREGESVYDIEITTNRVDSFCVRGIAREAAVILQHFNIPAKLKPLTFDHQLTAELDPNNELPLPKIANNPTLNKRTTCVVLKNVNRTPTPEWMAKRLRQIDMNVHDSVIDITNYVTHELGYPCHAFDYDKLMNLGGEINIVEADPGEKFVTLDNSSFETVGGEVVFKNGRGQIIDLPSIKGTQNTSIDESTKNVLLLLEAIAADKVRFASMTHAIRTTAAQLMEKNVDPHLAEGVLKKGTELYIKLCSAQVASLIYDDFSGQQAPPSVTIDKTVIDQYLGINLPIDKIQQILVDLECQVKITGEQLIINPPTFRSDLQIPADIVEEIARIYGYHNLPSVLMPTAIPLAKPQGLTFDLETKIKHLLSTLGWQEIYTYSLVSEELAIQSGIKLADHLKIQNPLTEDKVYLRRSLIPSLIEVHLANPLAKNLSVFEIANLYPPREHDIPTTGTHLAMVSNQNYRWVRGELEVLLDKLFVSSPLIQPLEVTNPQFSQQAQIMIGDHQLGSLGILKNGLVTVELEMNLLLPEVKRNPSYQPISHTSAVIEDLTFTLKSTVQIGEVLKTIKAIDPLIDKIELADIYQQNYTFTIFYHNREANLTTQDIEPIRKKVTTSIKEKFDGQLVGTV